MLGKDLCAKQVISLDETMKLSFFSRSVRPDDLHVSLVNAKVSFAIDF